MDKQKLIIYFIVAVMVLSVVGLGVVLLVDGSSSNSTEDDLAAQLEQQQQQQQAAEDAQADALACQSLPPDSSASPIQPPEQPFIPEGDVAELEVTDLEAGDGEAVEADSCLVVHYHGTLASDGEVFDSSYERGSPARFPLSNVIAGWRQGLLGMMEGGTRRLVIPSELAYGTDGNPPLIAPDTDLVFVVELIRIEQ
jgi:FKBP-type peptidyl-prolyl cis-trans isomerase